MTARYWYTDAEGKTVGMEWRPMTEEDRPLEPNEPEPVEEPEDTEETTLDPPEQPKTDEVPE